MVTIRQQEQETRRRELDRKRQIFEARMTMLRAEFEVEEETIQQSISESKLLDKETLLQDRRADGPEPGSGQIRITKKVGERASRLRKR